MAASQVAEGVSLASEQAASGVIWGVADWQAVRRVKRRKKISGDFKIGRASGRERV